jgi:glutamyl-tRNA synthetase
MSVVVRFAPSPTGFLHIGGHGRLCSTGCMRATQGRLPAAHRGHRSAALHQAAIDAIIAGLKWLGLDWDDEIVFQFARAGRHAEVARRLLAVGKAYHCYCTPQELQAMRESSGPRGSRRAMTAAGAIAIPRMRRQACRP